jgi:hypothetical protein
MMKVQKARKACAILISSLSALECHNTSDVTGFMIQSCFFCQDDGSLTLMKYEFIEIRKHSTLNHSLSGSLIFYSRSYGHDSTVSLLRMNVSSNIRTYVCAEFLIDH